MKKITLLTLLTLGLTQFGMSQTALNSASDILSFGVNSSGTSLRIFQANGNTILGTISTSTNTNYGSTIYLPQEVIWDNSSDRFISISKLNSTSSWNTISIHDGTWGNNIATFNDGSSGFSYNPIHLCKGYESNTIYFTENFNNSIQKLNYSNSTNTPTNIVTGGPYGPIASDSFSSYLVVNKDNKIKLFYFGTGCFLDLVTNIPNQVKSIALISNKVYYTVDGDEASGGGLYTFTINSPGCSATATPAQRIWSNMASAGGNAKWLDKDSSGNLYLSVSSTLSTPILKFTASMLSSENFEKEIVPIKIYPNPVKDILNLDAIDNTEILSAKIYDLQGKLILESNSNSINTSNLSSGLYLIKINTEKGELTKKFIKE